MASKVIFLAFVLLFTSGSVVNSASRIKIENNGYSDILVAFDNNISEKDGEPLIAQIKALFTSGSQALYKATRDRAYFKEVTILVPKSWRKKPEYQGTTYESFAEADVRITEPNTKHGDGPYTLQVLPCANPGNYIHLTPNYLKNLTGSSTSNYGDPGKTLVHEWAHLRYGIFNEYHDDNQPSRFPRFYQHGKEYLPNACSNAKLKGKLWNIEKKRECEFAYNGAPEADCSFIADQTQNNKVTASLGAYHFLPNVYTFCDDTPEFQHDASIPNLHNARCNGRSAWNVISSHEDFAHKNPPAEIDNVLPKFKIIQQEDAIFVLVLDISGSMQSPANYPNIQKLNEAATRWVQEEVQINSAVGIVTFGTTSQLTQPIVKITSEAVKNQVIRGIPSRTDGMTCIGCGIRTALQALRNYGKSTGGKIVLLSDGGENVSPLIKDVTSEIKNAKVRVITVAFTENADKKLEDLALMTGGKTYFVPNNAGVMMLDGVFHDVSTIQTTDEDLSTMIKEKRCFNSADDCENEFVIDSTIGRETAVNFLYSDKNDISDITIRGPGVWVSMHGQSTASASIKILDRQKQVRFEFTILQPGRYKYLVSRKGSRNQDITVNIMSKAKTKGEAAIRTKCTTEQLKNFDPPRFLILAAVMKGEKAVINAEVIARIDRPKGNSTILQLFDNGRQGDLNPNDGIYSGYFTKFNGAGRYSVQAHVVASYRTATTEIGFTASKAIPIIQTDTVFPNITNVPTGEFERFASAGSIQITTNLNTETTNIFPPSQITDLRLIRVAPDNSKVFLQWSAPGDDLDNGQAAEYELRYTLDRYLLQTSFYGQRYNHTTPPLSAGETENLEADIPGLGADAVYYIAIKTKDKGGLWSEMSNIIEVRGHN